MKEQIKLRASLLQVILEFKQHLLGPQYKTVWKMLRLKSQAWARLFVWCMLCCLLRCCTLSCCW